MKRQPNEDYEKYRERRASANKALRIYLKGRLWWDSLNRGTYRKKEVPNAV